MPNKSEHIQRYPHIHIVKLNIRVDISSLIKLGSVLSSHRQDTPWEKASNILGKEFYTDDLP